MDQPNNARVIKFLEKMEVKIRDQNTVKVDIDKGCEMAQIHVNGGFIMMGNFWDFHPDCHGFDLPQFNGHDSLASILALGMEAVGKKVEIKLNDEWVYED